MAGRNNTKLSAQLVYLTINLSNIKLVGSGICIALML